MSFYLLHILNEGYVIKKHRGHLICEKNGEARQIALEDLRGVILAAKDTMLSDQLISGILSHDAFILHCNEKYQPIGLTTPLQRLARASVAEHQAKATDALKSATWRLLMAAKTRNQIAILKFMKCRYLYLEAKIKEKPINESACARYYWREYFKGLGYDKLTRRHDPEHMINGMLNYGYAVLGALCHRSLVAHGLSPLFGVHHKGNFHGHPLVYDIIEPWRSFVDYHLCIYLSKNPQSNMKEWIQESRCCWEQIVSIAPNNHQKLVDAMDYCVKSLATVFDEQKTTKLWLPQMTNIG